MPDLCDQTSATLASNISHKLLAELVLEDDHTVFFVFHKCGFCGHNNQKMAARSGTRS